MVPESRRVPDRSRANATGNAETDLSRLRRVVHPEIIVLRVLRCALIKQSRSTIGVQQRARHTL